MTGWQPRGGRATPGVAGAWSGSTRNGRVMPTRARPSFDDPSCWRSYERYDKLIRDQIGRSLPILATENGYIVGERPDPRYPATTPQLHMAQTLEACRIMMGTSSRFDHAPDYYLLHGVLAAGQLQAGKLVAGLGRPGVVQRPLAGRPTAGRGRAEGRAQAGAFLARRCRAGRPGRRRPAGRRRADGKVAARPMVGRQRPGRMPMAVTSFATCRWTAIASPWSRRAAARTCCSPAIDRRRGQLRSQWACSRARGQRRAGHGARRGRPDGASQPSC